MPGVDHDVVINWRAHLHEVYERVVDYIRPKVVFMIGITIFFVPIALMAFTFGTVSLFSGSDSCHLVYRASSPELGVNISRCVSNRGRIALRLGPMELSPNKRFMWAPEGCCRLKEHLVHRIEMSVDSHFKLEIDKNTIEFFYYSYDGSAMNLTEPIFETFYFDERKFARS